MAISKPMLAGKADISAIRYPVLVTHKVDGIRCLKIDGRAVTRKFKSVPNNYVRSLIERSSLPSGIDGELIVDGAAFNDTSSGIMSIDGEPDFRYLIFDYVERGNLSEPYSDRMRRLSKLDVPKWGAKLLPTKVVDYGALLEYESRALADGFEGIMIRSPDGPYKCGRSTTKEGFLMKLKRFEDSEAKVVGFEEKMHNANDATKDAFGRTERSSHKANMIPTGVLGALVVAWGSDEVMFRVGSGFDDAQRKDIWLHQRKYIGRLVKFRFQPSGLKELPRFPTFIGWRHEDDL